MSSLGHRISIDLLRGEAGDEAGVLGERDLVALDANLVVKPLAHPTGTGSLHANRPEADHALTFKLDHSVGARHSVSIGLGIVGLLAFFWTMKNRQYEDPQGDAERILRTDYDDEPAEDRKHR